VIGKGDDGGRHADAVVGRCGVERSQERWQTSTTRTITLIILVVLVDLGA
jgi:hypothetical protein